MAAKDARNRTRNECCQRVMAADALSATNIVCSTVLIRSSGGIEKIRPSTMSSLPGVCAAVGTQYDSSSMMRLSHRPWHFLVLIVDLPKMHNIPHTQTQLKLHRTKIALQAASGSYVLLLWVLCMTDYLVLAEVLNLLAVGLGLIFCGSGASRLCSALRSTQNDHANTAKVVFDVSRSMGLCFCEFQAVLSVAQRKKKAAEPE